MNHLKNSTKLTHKIERFDSWDDFTEESYQFYSLYRDLDEKPVGIHFRCPGCKQVIYVEIQIDPNQKAKWEIDFKTLTARPSILHTKDDKHSGCGWHGYLTNGILAPC